MTINLKNLASTVCLTLTGVVFASCGPKASDSLAENPVVQNKEQAASNISKSAELTDPVLKRGKRMFLRCKSCHTVEAGGRSGTGPNLHGIFGAKAAKKEGFNYSKAMIASELVWDDATMDAWIEKPNRVVPKTSMAFIGLKKAEDREALIAYLKSVTE